MVFEFNLKITCNSQCINFVVPYLQLTHIYNTCSNFNNYYGSIVNTDNTMEEEIKERIALGNKVYFGNKKMFQSRLISKRAKLKLYYSVIRPIVTFSCETWILTL